MIFNSCKISATVFVHDAYCECGNYLKEVSNGFISAALFCPKCENVYILKRIKVNKKKVPKDFLEQCRFEVKFDEEKILLRKRLKGKA